MQAKLIISFSRLSDSDLLTKSALIITSLTGNPAFPEPWPAQAPSLAQLGQYRDDFASAYQASQTHDSVKIARRNAVRQVLEEQLKHLAHYLEFVAHRNPDALANTGFDQRRDPVRGAHATILPAPSHVRIDQSPLVGCLDLHADKVAGARSYEVEITQGDPMVETNWKHALTTATDRNIHLTGLTPGQAYWLRLRAISTDHPGAWSDPVNVIVS